MTPTTARKLEARILMRWIAAEQAVAAEARVVFIYWIQSVSTGRDYIGITYNLCRRLLQHNGVIPGGAVVTTNDPGPWVFCKVVTAHNWKQAEILEHRVKVAIKRCRHQKSKEAAFTRVTEGMARVGP